MNQGPSPFDPTYQQELETMKALSDQLDREMETFLNGLLPVLDKVEQACRGIDCKTPEQLADCARMLALLPDIVDDATAAIGLDRIGRVGEPCEPLRHKVSQVQQSELPKGTIVEVFECGWEFDGRILRRALVAVSDDQGPVLDAKVS